MAHRPYTRVAVVQLAYHPAIVLSSQSPLEDPLFAFGADDSLRVEDELPFELEERMANLRQRIQQVYLSQFRSKLLRILAQCQTWGVRIVVFPEYSIPAQLLHDITKVCGEMVVVAGTHTVTRQARRDRLYAELGGTDPLTGTAVCPVLYRGRLLSLGPKLNPAKPEDGQMHPGESWHPVELPDGLPSPMGVLVCLDFLYRESDAHKALVLPQLEKCRFLAVPSLTSTHSLAEFSTKAWEDARRYGRPVLYCDAAGNGDKIGGGTSVFVDEGHPGDLRKFPERAGYLEAGEEGVIVADVDLGHVRVGESTRYQTKRPVRPFAAAGLLYQFHPVDAQYAGWLDELSSQMEQSGMREDDLLESISERIEGARKLLEGGASIGGPARARRLRDLLKNHSQLSALEEVRRRTREIILPPETLPLPLLRAMMASAASELVFEWGRVARHSSLMTLSDRLRKAVAKAIPSSPAERTESGTLALEAIRSALVGDDLKPPVPPPPAVEFRPVLPDGLDPVTLGDQQIDGLAIHFRASVDEFRFKASFEIAVQSEEQYVRRTRRAQIARAFADSALDVARDLLLLARAEGKHRCAAVVFEESHELGNKHLCVLVPNGDGWELWFDADVGALGTESASYGARLSRLGFKMQAAVPLSSVERHQRTAALLTRIPDTSEQLRQRRDSKLREVGGHFVDLTVQVEDSGEGEQSGLLALDGWLASGEQTALLLGEFGSGKSTLLAEWCARLATSSQGPRPLLVDLAQAPLETDGLGMLADAAGVSFDAPQAPSARATLELLIRARLILPCFDGLDEMATRSGELHPGARLAALLRVAAGEGRLLLSCRDHYFKTHDELRTTVRQALSQTLGEAAGARILHVLPLGTAQTKDVIAHTLATPELRQQATERIASTYDLRDLIKRPLLLTMVLQSFDRLRPGARVATADVYEAYIQRWLEHTREDDLSLPRAQKLCFAEALAERLWRSGAPSCTWQALREAVAGRIGQFRAPEHLPDAAAFLDIQGGAFFVHAGDDSYAFAHKSFLEYFFARSLVHDLPLRRDLALDTQPITQEVASFVGEILKLRGDPRESPALAGLLADRVGRSDESRKNALRLLIGLSRWSGEPGGWIPEAADLTGLRLWNEDLAQATLCGVRLSHSDLSGVDLTGADLSRADLTQACLAGAKLSQARLDGCRAVRANLTAVEADHCSVVGADLTEANLTQSVWTNCDWTGALIAGAAVTAAGMWGGISPASSPLDADLGIPSTAVSSTAPEMGFSQVNAVAYSPDGQTLASASSDRTVWLWDAASGRLLQTLEGHQGLVRSVVYSRDGETLASASSDRTVRLWDASSGRLLQTLEGHQNVVRSIAYSPDSKTLASASSDHTVRLWDAASGRLLRTLKGHRYWVLSVAYSPDSKTLASASSDCTVRLWDAASGLLLRTLDGHKAGVLSIAYSPDGQTLASGSSDRTVRLWDTASGRLLQTLEGHQDLVRSVAYSPDGQTLASASSDNTARLWAVDSGRLVRTLEGHHAGVHSVAYSPDGQTLASASDDRTVRLWDTVSGRSLRILEGHQYWVRSVAYSPNGQTLASASDGRTVRLWDAASSRLLRTLEGHQNRIRFVAYSPDGQTLASGSDDRTVRLWDAGSGLLLRTLEGHQYWVRSVAYSPNGQTLASASDDRTVRLWDAASGLLLRTLEGHQTAVLAVAYSPDGQTLASASDDRTVRLWDTASGRLLKTLKSHQDRVLAVAYSPDGQTLASASYDRTVRLWDAASGRLLRTLESHQNRVLAVAYSPDGQTLASASDDSTVRLWDAASGRLLRTLEGHQTGVLAVAYSPDGQTLASASYDSTVRLWDLRETNHIALWTTKQGAITTHSLGYFQADEEASEVALLVADPRYPQAQRWLPLAGLRSVLHRPDYIAATLAHRGPSRAQRDSELLAAGFTGGRPWDGEPRFAPASSQQPTQAGRGATAPLRTNPFRPGPAQEDALHLPGRDAVVAELRSLIGSRSPAVLIGPRRSGKTSILKHLRKALAPERRVAYLSLEGAKPQTADDLSSLFLEALALPGMPTSIRSLSKEVAQKLGELQPAPVLLIDELVHLHQGDDTLFPWLRALGQDKACLLLAGSPHDWVTVVRRAAAVAPGSSFGNDVTPVHLGPISDDDGRRFLVETSAGEISADAAAGVLELCGPWPFYLQVLGHALFEQASRGLRRALLDRSALHDVYQQRLIADRTAVFGGRWEELPSPVRRLLLQTAEELQRPAFLKQPPELRRLLVDTGLCDTFGRWLADRPLFDWIRANLPLLSTD